MNMETLMLWCGFIGAWLLFAGPVYQAALELKDEDIERERIKAAGDKVDVSLKVSPWWWLFPPAKIILQNRQTKIYRRAYIAVLKHEDVEALISFINKATAWLFVALGGLLIAVKETFELTGHYNISNSVFWILIVVMAVLCVLNTIVRMIRGVKITAQHKS